MHGNLKRLSRLIAAFGLTLVLVLQSMPAFAFISSVDACAAKPSCAAALAGSIKPTVNVAAPPAAVGIVLAGFAALRSFINLDTEVTSVDSQGQGATTIIPGASPIGSGGNQAAYMTDSDRDALATKGLEAYCALPTAPQVCGSAFEVKSPACGGGFNYKYGFWAQPRNVIFRNSSNCVDSSTTWSAETTNPVTGLNGRITTGPFQHEFRQLNDVETWLRLVPSTKKIEALNTIPDEEIAVAPTGLQPLPPAPADGTVTHDIPAVVIDSNGEPQIAAPMQFNPASQSAGNQSGTGSQTGGQTGTGSQTGGDSGGGTSVDDPQGGTGTDQGTGNEDDPLAPPPGLVFDEQGNLIDESTGEPVLDANGDPIQQGDPIPDDLTDPTPNPDDPPPPPDDPDAPPDDTGTSTDNSSFSFTPATFNRPNFVSYAQTELADKFPLDVVGQIQTTGTSACPEFGFFGYTEQFCIINDILSAAKYPVWIRFVIYLVTHI